MLGVFALSVMISLSACKQDDPEPEACENGTFEVTVNGDAVTGNSFNNTLFKGSSAGTSGKRMDIRATDTDGRQFIISFTDLSTGTNGKGVSTAEYTAIDDVVTGSENAFFFTIIEGGVSESFTDGDLDITTCDADAKKISGTFSFSYGDLEVTNGSFTDMCYTIIQ